MKTTAEKKQRLRLKRAQRVRRQLRQSERPRLSVHRSNRHIGVQLIDDAKGVTLAGISTESKPFRNTEHGKVGRSAAAKLGQHIAQMALKLKVDHVVFDRGPYKYHGCIAALAEAAREAGLKF